jgi:3-phosphoshikimate 1-carboxyvinyltransferase
MRSNTAKERDIICACIGEQDSLKCANAINKCKFAELRGDLCGLKTAEVKKIILSHPHLIFTYRITPQTKTIAREQMLAAIQSGAEYIDIQENAPADVFKEIKEEIEKNDTCKLIVSYHNFESTPQLAELKAIAERCKNLGANLVKIVPTAANISEASRVLQLYKLFPDNLIAFAMGNAGKFTRVASLYLGAPFAYCSYTTQTADGQYTVAEMKKITASGNYEFQVPSFASSKLFSPFTKASAGENRKAINKSVTIPCSKSIAQRAIIAASIAKGESILENFEPCNDITSAINFARKAGCLVTSKRRENNTGEKYLIIKSPGIEQWKKFQLINTGESGLLTRLLMPVLSYVSSIRSHTEIASKITITGEGSLLKRDLGSAVISLRESGAWCTAAKENKYLPFVVGAEISKHRFAISGKESSQTISGFLMTLPLLNHDSVMEVDNPASVPYIMLTISILKQFGIKIKCTAEKDKLVFYIKGGQEYGAVHFLMDSDWSSASNFAVAGAIASSMVNCKSADEKSEKSSDATFTIKSMNTKTNQADEAILDVLMQCGVKIKFSKSSNTELIKKQDVRYDMRRSVPSNLKDITISARRLNAFDFDATNCPDLFPILAALAIHCNGTSKIKGVGRLLKKESNRAEAIIGEFTKIGADICVDGDVMIINGLQYGSTSGSKSSGRACGTNDYALCSSRNDHRIAMALIIEGMLQQYYREQNNIPFSIKIDEVKCIDKSFPSFLERLQLKK